MHNQPSYIMYDQVNDLVPSLMTPIRKRRYARVRKLLEVAVFIMATASYLAALTLAA